MKVENVMRRGALWVEADTPVSEIAKIMHAKDVGTVLVGRNDRLVGLVTDRDIVCRAVANGKTWSNALARDVMTRKVAYCLETDDLSDALAIMRAKKIRRLAVLTGQKRLSGLISLSDIVGKAPEDFIMLLLPSVMSRHRSKKSHCMTTPEQHRQVL